jgi:signal transduction histidine kinase
MEQETIQQPVTMTTLLEQARERLPGKDYVYYYLQLENAIVSSNISYTKESLRAVIKENFNIMWFDPKLKVLFEEKNAEQLIFSEIILESILKHLSEKNPTVVQKIVNEKTKGTILEGITIKQGSVDLIQAELKIFSDEKQFDNVLITIYELLKSLSTQDKTVLSDAFDEVKGKYLTLPSFINVVRAIPPEIFEEERRKILGPQAAAVAVTYLAKELFDQQQGQDFLKKIEDVNKLPLEKQTEAFFNIYRVMENFIRENKPDSIEELRERVREQVIFHDLPLEFQLSFLSPSEQLLVLGKEFLESFTSKHVLDLAINVKQLKKNLVVKIPLLNNSLTEEGDFSNKIILKNLQLIKKVHRVAELKSALMEMLAFFYQKAIGISSVDRAQNSLKESYLLLQQKFGMLASNIVNLLPAEILSAEERHTLLVACYKEFIESLMDNIPNNKIKDELLPSFTQLSQEQFPLKEDGIKLQTSFSRFFESVVKKTKQKLGHDQTEHIFEIAYNIIKEKYGGYPIFNEILQGVPRGILEIERFNMLSKEELEKVSKALKRGEQAKSTFTNVAAHELKTPLVPILGYAKMLADKKLSPEKVQQYAEIIYQNAVRQEKLVTDLLSISKLEAGEMKFEMADLDLLPLLRQAVTGLSLEAKKKGIQIKSALPKSLPHIYSDSQRLTQVIVNLIGNALKFTQKGSITITAKVINNAIQITITDTGMGIKKEDIPRLFTKFVQTQDYTTRKTQGTGLGLAICKEIIQAHHGKIWVESSGVGKGSIFFFTLPITKTPPTPLTKRAFDKKTIPQEQFEKGVAQVSNP